ncbi:MAG TPA: hypothetical protein VK843_06640, partial [Planctomycetota bacterium]|nr:hypothetical protein [Planctomycetota bacterium]
LLPAVLAIPALLFGSALGAFAATARSVRRSSSGATPITGTSVPRRSVPGFNRGLRLGSGSLDWGFVAALLACPILGGKWAIDALLLVLLVSMASLGVSVKEFARAGILSRVEVTRCCVALLMSLACGCFMWMGMFHVPDTTSTLGIGWSWWVLFVGAALCLWVGDRASPNIKPVVLGVLLIAANPMGWTRSSPQALRGQLAAIPLDPAEWENWEEAAALHYALNEIGTELPDMSAISARVGAAIESNVDGDPTRLDRALQMGLIDREHRALLAGRPEHHTELQELRSGSGPLTNIRSGAFLIGLIHEEIANEPSLRARIADRIEAGWPQVGGYGSLEDAWLCVRSLDAIGENRRAELLRDSAYEILRSHWVSRGTWPFPKPGGFTSNPDTKRSSKDDTWFAVQLMQRLGAPPQIDLRLLRGYLRTESRVMFFDYDSEFEAQSRASLRLLEDQIGMPARNPIQRVLDERLLVASLLLVGLCILAIRLAPSFEPKGKGALP